jgi:hypothetical protein
MNNENIHPIFENLINKWMKEQKQYESRLIEHIDTNSEADYIRDMRSAQIIDQKIKELQHELETLKAVQEHTQRCIDLINNLTK